MPNPKDLGKKALDGLRKSGATDALFNIGINSVIPGASSFNEDLKISDSLVDQVHNWFDDLPYEKQQKYAKEHEDSEVVKKAKRKGTLKKSKEDDDNKKEEPEEKPEPEDEPKPVEEKQFKRSPKTVNKDRTYRLKRPLEKKRGLKRREKRSMDNRKRNKKLRKGNIRGVPELTSIEDLNSMYEDLIKSAEARLQGYTETAEMDENTKEAFKCLYLVLHYITSDEPIPNDIGIKSGDWEQGLDSFLSKYRIPKLHLKKLVDAAQYNREFTEKLQESILKAGSALNSKKLAFEKDTTLSKLELQTIKAFISFFKRQSETASKFLDKNLHHLHSADLNALFASSDYFSSEDDITQSKQSMVVKDLEKIAKKIKKKGSVLNTQELQELRMIDPEAAKEYNRKRKEFLDVYKNFVRNYVRQSGKTLVDYERLYRALEDSGITHNLQKGFKGLIDSELNYYTTKGIMIDGKPGGPVTMNNKYDPTDDNTYVFRAKTPMGFAAYYTTKYKAGRKTKKFDTVSALEKKIVPVRKRWLLDIKKGEPKKKIMATQLEMMYKFAGRSGRSGNQTKGEATYGITTLLVKHVKTKGNGFVIKYPGKKGTMQIHEILPNSIDNRRLIKILSENIKDKKPSDLVWTYRDKPVLASATLKYLKEISGIGDAKLHHLRHMMGTKIARQVIKESSLKKGVSQSAAEKWYKEAMIKVGQALAHQTGGKVTSTTAIKNYINPQVQAAFFTSLGLRVPAWVPKTVE